MTAARLGWPHWQKAFAPADGRKTYLHLERASTQGVCHCTCERALAAVPGQLDCPWCGCGWLFSCASCGNAFTYAKPVRIAHPLSEIVEWDYVGRGYDKAKHRSIIKSSEKAMSKALKSVKEGSEYVYLDESFVPVDSTNFTLKGTYAKHKIETLPHALELRKPGSLAVLEDPDYWINRKWPDPENDDEETRRQRWLSWLNRGSPGNGE